MFHFCVSLSVGLEPKKKFCMSEKNSTETKNLNDKRLNIYRIFLETWIRT